MMLKFFLCAANAAEDAAATAAASPEVETALAGWLVALALFGGYSVWRIARREMLFRAGMEPLAAVRGWGRGLLMNEAFACVALAVVAAYLLAPFVFSVIPRSGGRTEGALLAMTAPIAAVFAMSRLIPRVNPKFAFTTGAWRALWRWREGDANGDGVSVNSGDSAPARRWRVWHPVPTAAAGVTVAWLVTQAQQLFDTLWQWLGGAPLGLHETQDVVRMIADGSGDAMFLALAGVSAVVLAPLSEELFFRGLIYPFLKERHGAPLAIFVTGALFGAIHLSRPAFLPLAVFGAFLCLVYERTGDIRGAIAVHALFNLNTFLLLIASNL